MNGHYLDQPLDEILCFSFFTAEEIIESLVRVAGFEYRSKESRVAITSSAKHNHELLSQVDDSPRLSFQCVNSFAKGHSKGRLDTPAQKNNSRIIIAMKNNRPIRVFCNQGYQESCSHAKNRASAYRTVAQGMRALRVRHEAAAGPGQKAVSRCSLCHYLVDTSSLHWTGSQRASRQH